MTASIYSHAQLLNNLCELCSLLCTVRGHQHWNKMRPGGGWACRGWHRLWHHQEWQWHLHCQVHSTRSRPIYHHGAVCRSGKKTVFYLSWGGRAVKLSVVFIFFTWWLYSSGNSSKSVQSESGSFPRCWKGESRRSWPQQDRWASLTSILYRYLHSQPLLLHCFNALTLI